MTLPELTAAILALNGGSMQRLRLAKTIYFVHKELVRKKLMQLNDIEYVRLPLGPAPAEFSSLAHDFPALFLLERIPLPMLSYETDLFSTPKTPEEIQTEFQTYHAVILRTLAILDKQNISELVALSCRDQSWASRRNGERYFITKNDLHNTLPRLKINLDTLKIIKRSPRPSESEIIQAKLLRGMLSDIVEESTDLEYPDE